MIDVETYAAAKAYTDKQGGGSGEGDMKKSVYDSDLAVANAGGIGAFVSDSEKDIYAVMGEMGAKNLNSYPYNETTHTDNGVDWTNNKDGTVTANNAATGNSTFLCHARQSTSANRLIVPNGKYILTGCPAGGSDSTYRISANITKNGSAVGLGTDYGNGVIITVNGDDNYQDKAVIQIGCDVRNGYTANNLTFHPMLRLASDTDDTYQQYAKTNKQLTDEIANKVDKVEGKGLSTNDYDDTEKGKVADNAGAIEAIVNEYGAKNLLPTGESGTYSGLTFTVNADGSITISGTASDNVYYTVACPKLYAGDYILTGYPSSAIGMNCSLYYDGMPGSDTGDGQPFTLSQYVDNKNVYIFVASGTNFTTPITFYPMIRDARITDPTYVPYAMTNRELTDRVEEVICPVNIDKFGSYINAGGSLSDLWPYYVASIPVSEGTTIKILNPATNTATYNRFYDNANQPVGNVIQNPSSGSLTLTVPTGAVMLKLSMYNNSGAPRLKIS